MILEMSVCSNIRINFFTKRINNYMTAKSNKHNKKITADMILDLYKASKKLKGVKQKELMDKVRFLSQHLNEYMFI